MLNWNLNYKVEIEKWKRVALINPLGWNSQNIVIEMVKII